MAATSLLLNVNWVKPGHPSDPTVLAFTGFGHRLDPWVRLQPAGWRVGVLEFPVGAPPTQVWEPEALAAQLQRFWGQASHRALMAFSFGAAGATAVASVLAKAEQALQPAFTAYVAPVQWARAPWALLRSIPARRRLGMLKGVASGAGKVAGTFGNGSIKQFVRIVDNYVGWDFVAFYLPYLDWIASPRKTMATWAKHPWESLLFGGTADRVIPPGNMAKLASGTKRVTYTQVESTHFNALDRAAPALRARLAAIVTGSGEHRS